MATSRRWGAALALGMLGCGGVDGGAELFDERPLSSAGQASDASQPQSASNSSENLAMAETGAAGTASGEEAGNSPEATVPSPMSPSGGAVEPSPEVGPPQAPNADNEPLPSADTEPAAGVPDGNQGFGALDNVAECPSYDEGFLPLVVEPVCGNCHGVRSSLPDFEPFAAAQSNCAAIGSEVARGSMPPGGGLSREQRDLVLRWASLDCPQTQAQALAQCVPGAQGPEAPAVSTISVERARYDADDEELEIRGEVSSELVTLVVEFGERVEPLENEEGSFRETFEGVQSPPTQIVVIASDGATTSFRVEVRD